MSVCNKSPHSPPFAATYSCAILAAMSYQKDYAKAALEMKAALEDLRMAESRAVALQRRMAALHVLIVADNPEWEHATGEDLDFSLKILRATSRPSEQLRRIFERSKGSLTVKELREELRQVGCDLSQQANPSGTIGALCARLAEQGFIRRTKKDGRNAWEKL